MNLKFIDEGHKYQSDDNLPWKSVTSITKMFEEEFDADKQAFKSSKNPKSKWYKMDVNEIKRIWKKTNTDAVELGKWYHNEREKHLCSVDSIEREGDECKIIRPIINGIEKYAPEQKLENNHLYPEHFVYLKSARVCGQSDLVEIRKNKVYITDYKTNANLTTEGWKDWRGESKKLLFPVSHLEDCKLSIYTIQLSLYMYIILKHNPELKPGKLYIHHIIFKKVSEDKYGNAIYDRDYNNEPIVEKVVVHEVPYLKDEVIAILNQLKK